METVRDFIFFGSKITAYGNCSHEIKRCLVLGRRAMTNLDSILKGRDINLLTKVHLVKAMVFPVFSARQYHGQRGLAVRGVAGVGLDLVTKPPPNIWVKKKDYIFWVVFIGI